MKKARARAARAMMMAMRLVGKDDCKHSKGMVIATRVAGEQTATLMKCNGDKNKGVG